MATFVALYRGQTVASATLIAVTADPDIVADVSNRILVATHPLSDDPVIAKLERGRRAALRHIHTEAAEAEQD